MKNSTVVPDAITYDQDIESDTHAQSGLSFSFAVRKAVMNGEERQLEPIVNAGFVEDVGKVMFDRVLRIPSASPR